MKAKVIAGTLLLWLFAVVAPLLVAQSLVSGDLTGTVTDPSGAVVPDANVTLSNDATGAARTTTTNSNAKTKELRYHDVCKYDTVWIDRDWSLVELNLLYSTRILKE